MHRTALSVANTILKAEWASGRQVDHLKLQKLLYLAQGVSLALHDEPLFEEKIEAWRYGPVVPSVYQAAKRFGSKPITKQLENRMRMRPEVAASDSTALEVLAETLKAYGHFKGVELVALTHNPKAPEGRPWVDAYEAADTEFDSPVIPLNALRASFRQLVSVPTTV